MTPTREQLEDLFDKDEAVQDWVEDRLDEMAKLKYPSIEVSTRSFEIYEGKATAEIWEVRYCSCCNDEHAGDISVTIDELLDSATYMERVEAERKYDAKQVAIQKAVYKEQQAKAVESKDLAEYHRLKEKYGKS